VDKVYCVYILTNQRNTVLYTGVTGDLGARVYQHREKLLAGFTNRTTCPSSSIMRRDTMRPGP
jgi:putative endonuclease